MDPLYTMDETAALARVVQSAAPSEWVGDPDEVLLAARAREAKAMMIPAASGCAVLDFELVAGFDDGNLGTWRMVADEFSRAIAAKTATLLFGIDGRNFQFWQRQEPDKLDDLDGVEIDFKARAKATTFAWEPVIVWHPTPDWVRVVTGGLVDG